MSDSEDALSEQTLDDEQYYENYSEPLILLCDISEIKKFGASIVPLVYYLVFLLSIFGNGLILFILLKYEKLKTVTNIFILNLIGSDLLFTVSLPFWAVYYTSEWIFGHAMCKIISSLYGIGFYSSMLFLIMLTIDRYLAVVHAVCALRTRRICYATFTSVIIWVVSIICSMPKVILYGLREENRQGLVCEETGYEDSSLRIWKTVEYLQQIVLYFLLPLLIIIYCYIMIATTLVKSKMQEKHKAVRLIFTIVVVFFICWTPYNIVVFLLLLYNFQHPYYDNCDNSLDYALYICRNIAYFHCCINPFFYTFVGTKFRRHLLKLLGTKYFWRRHYIQHTSSGRSSEVSPPTLYE
ncbi:C-C chemokine receptor type 3-like [Protopterus annectens]|uniref:C-C chemokine receptor type 3-like n=1 Tax=Protopterus annectens TaxID=7888 RepID=UPI001CF9F02D|nr:C-C chemokine receptor type 3-like [Protopterus annectens]